MFTFSVVRRIGEGGYLVDDRFIIERARKLRALNAEFTEPDGTSPKPKKDNRDERFHAS